MPCVGRVLNMTSDIYELAQSELKDTFFISPAPDKNQCFYGNCIQFCNIDHPICGKDGLLEVSLNLELATLK